MTSTINAWQRPLAYTTPTPSHPPHSGWVALEKTPKEKDTTKLIQKAEDQATLLMQLLDLGDKPSSLEELQNNDILQQVYKSCQDFSAELAERVAEDDDFIDDDNHNHNNNMADFSVVIPSSTPYSASSSSASSTYVYGNIISLPTQKEAQIAALLATIERLQLAFKLYNELEDHLHAKKLQNEENFYATEAGVRASHLFPTSAAAASLAHTTRQSATARPPTVSTARADLFDGSNDDDDDDEDEEDEDEDEDGTPRSQQPIEYVLDPRPDYRANQQRMKNGKMSAERLEAKQERMREKVTIDPSKIDTATLIIEQEEEKEDNDKDEDDEDDEDDEVKEAQQQSTEPHLVEEVMPVSEMVEGGFPSSQHVGEETGYLSDDSWQEVAEEATAQVSVEEEEVEVESGASSLIMLNQSAERNN
ncbi:hypothetical protein BGZ73_007455 [Actinomortierella ambigua]|nr:hypothetical protein BGZ73_007455 [Actinomortierella ambigua]